MYDKNAGNQTWGSKARSTKVTSVLCLPFPPLIQKELLWISLEFMRGLIRTHDLKISSVDTEAFLFKFKKLKWNEPKFGLKN